jgi:hypothetical protein
MVVLSLLDKVIYIGHRERLAHQQTLLELESSRDSVCLSR